jgi:hypothetical protein
MSKRIKFERIKLGRQKSWGLADYYPLQIDSRLKGKKELEIYIHESLHYLFPELIEEEIENKAIALTLTLWYEGYRKVDNSEEMPLQNGKK